MKNYRNAIALSRIALLMTIVIIAMASFIVALPLFCAYLVLFRIGQVDLLDFSFIVFILAGVPAACIFIIRLLLKQYKVI